jgi:hypothetical protein
MTAGAVPPDLRRRAVLDYLLQPRRRTWNFSFYLLITLILPRFLVRLSAVEMPLWSALCAAIGEFGSTRTPIPAQGGRQSGDCGQQVMAG